MAARLVSGDSKRAAAWPLGWERSMSINETKRRMVRIQDLSRLGEKAAILGCLAVVGIYAFVLATSTSEDLMRGNFVGPTAHSHLID
jgi:hypothetical protein